jgi:hypothetical protein
VVPSDATDVQQKVDQDGASLEVFFSLGQRPHDDDTVANELQRQLEAAGFTRCDKATRWQELPDRDQVVRNKRMVRFFTMGASRTLALLAVNQACESHSASSCRQGVVVKRVELPDMEMPAQELIKKICSGELHPA